MGARGRGVRLAGGSFLAVTRRDVLGKCEDTKAGERQGASLTAGGPSDREQRFASV